jgi:GNAT superfamily N-acetyltransferase
VTTTPSIVDRIIAFDERFAKAQSTDVVDLGFGYALVQRDFPRSNYHNRVAVTGPVSAAEVMAAADEVFGGAGLSHRYVSVDRGDAGGVDDWVPEEFRADLTEAGYRCETTVTMVHDGSELEPPPPPVREVSLDEVRPAIIRDWRVEMPDGEDETLRQLADRTALYERGAELVRLVVDDDGGSVIAAHANLYLDRSDTLAQFENLVTNPDYRRRGYGAALLADAVRRAAEAGCDVLSLTADLDDWPRHWYGRFGFAEVARTDHFSRAGR